MSGKDPTEFMAAGVDRRAFRDEGDDVSNEPFWTARPQAEFDETRQERVVGRVPPRGDLLAQYARHSPAASRTRRRISSSGSPIALRNSE
jgi:hypothetical protein